MIHQQSSKHGPNVSKTPLRQWGFQQCFIPFRWTTLRGKHSRHPIAVMGVVDTFRHEQMVGHQQRKEDPKTDQDHAHSQKIYFGGKYFS